MNKVICPNCHATTLPWRYCANCNAPIDIPLNNELAKQTEAVRCGMDPHLHWLVRRVQSQKISKLATASTKADWATVIAKVTDLQAFKSLDDVEIKTVINPVSEKDEEPKDPTWLVTARMPVSIVEEVRKKDFIRSLKAGMRMRPTLEKSLEASGAKDTAVEIEGNCNDATGEDGKGVIVGIVDFGMDFMHRNFRDSNGKTRILALWDQSATADSEHMQPLEFGFDYGRLYTKSDINNAIAAAAKVKDQSDVEKVCAAAYKALGYGPPEDTIFQVGAHGTYVADVAVGNGNGTGVSGFASNADIVFVELSTHPGPLLNNSFGDSAQLVEAIKFIFKFADDLNRPCVINLSVGTNGGPHNGTTLVEEAIDRMLREKKNRAVVVAAGNSFKRDLHVSGQIVEGETLDLKWSISKNDSTPNELEVWYPPDDRITVEVIDPFNISWGKVAPGWQIDLSDKCQGLLSVVNRLDEPNSGKNTINVFFENELHPGDWTLRLHCTKAKKGEETRFHAWIERDEMGQSCFVAMKPEQSECAKSHYIIDDSFTLNSIACGNKSIVVGSYDARTPGNKLGDSTSSGPSLNEHHSEKPDVSAPGELVLAAQSRTLVLRNRVAGTSLAAPVVTGIVASMLSVASKELSAERIREILIDTSQKDDPDLNHWHPRYGHGRVSKSDAVEAARGQKS